MTVCIAARCADLSGAPGRAVVVAADRMASGGGGLLSLEAAVTQPKIVKIADRSVVVLTGLGSLGHLFAADIANRLQGAPGALESSDVLAEVLAQQYGRERHQYMERDVFASRGLTIDSFYGGAHKETAPMLAGRSIERRRSIRTASSSCLPA
jgi:hypothetical protein